MSVILRQRQKGKRISLYLEINWNGTRKYEYPKLYLFPEPEKGRLTTEQKKHNKKMLAIAGKLRTERYWELENEQYGIVNKSKIKGSLVNFMESLATEREDSKGNFGNWKSAIEQIRKYDAKVTFAMIDKEWLEDWKKYLINTARTKAGKALKENTKKSYYDKLVAALKVAHRQGIILKNPVYEVEPFKEAETEVEFLTLEELNKAAKADCENSDLKRAFLFSALTGLRWSDVTKLTWSEIQYSDEFGDFIRFRTKKTKRFSTLNISKQARQLLGEIGEGDRKIFNELKYSSWNNLKLREWMLKAGITKKITFHCSRHTFATGQLSVGTDLYTVKEAMALASLRTVQRYAKVVNEKKKDAMSKIKLDL